MDDRTQRLRTEVLAAFHEACPRPTADAIGVWIAIHPDFADDIRVHAEASLAEAQDATGGAETTPTLIARTRARALTALDAARAAATSRRPGGPASTTKRTGIAFVDIRRGSTDPAPAGSTRRTERAGGDREETAVPFASMAAACGSPCPADDHMEEAIDVNDLLVRNPAATFAVRISGESMRDRGLQHGDVAVVDRGRSPVNGCMVLGMVDGEFTIKTFRSKDGAITLEAANPDFPDLVISEVTQFQVWGVLVGLARAL